jgi:putative inorganic carbon (HCO3(-)) transporter
VPGSALLPDRLVVAAAVVLTCALFTRAALDPVNVIKLTALLLVAVVLLALTASRIVRRRIVHLPASPAGVAAAVLAAAFCVAAVTAPMLSTALLGTYGRNSGLLAYLSALVLYVVGLRVFGDGHARVLVGGVVVAGWFTATYGLLQKAGLDAIPWNNPFNPIIAALGNPNFASGYLGIAASVGAGGALYSGWHRGWRAVSGVTAGLCLAAASLSASVQGPIAAAGGLFVVGVAFALNRTSRLRLGLLTGLGAAATLGVAALVVGAVARAGPAAAVFSDVGSEARTYYWGAALEMFRDQPVLGVGLDHYGAFWRTARSPESVAALGGPQYSDAAHSVPLQMLAQGGLVLGLAYAAFVLVALVALIRGLLRLRGRERMLLGAVGGGWTAYQVQSAVSIDQVPLVVLHFALAGAVVAAAGCSGLREVRLPGALKPALVHPNDARTKRRVAAAAAPRTRPVTGADLAFLSSIALLAIVAVWQSFTPLRANMAARDGDELLRQGDGTGAFQAYDRATELVPGQSFYWIKKGQLFQKATPPQTSQAQAAFSEAIAVDAYEVNALRAAAALAEADGQLDRSRSLHTQALAVDPLNPETVVAAARFELRHDGAAAARKLLLASVAEGPGSAAPWAALGDAHAVLRDPGLAREAYERALELEPGFAPALEGLDKLSGSPQPG